MAFSRLGVSQKVAYLQQAIDGDLSAEDHAELFASLLAGYPGFDSKALRNQAEAYLVKRAKLDLDNIATPLLEQAGCVQNLNESAAACLLQWLNAIISAVEPPEMDKFVEAQANLLLAISTGTRNRLYDSAVTNSSRVCAQYVERVGAGPISSLLQKKTLASVILTAVAARGAIVVADQRPAVEAAVKSTIADFVAAYISSVLGSNVASQKLLRSLQSIFEYLTQGLYDEQLAPALARAVLRSPEFTLSKVLPPFLAQTTQLDASELLSKMQTSLLSNLSSSNEVVRQSAASILGCLLQRVPSAAEPVAAAAKRSSNPVQRALFGVALRPVAQNVRPIPPAVIDALTTLAGKEGTETGLESIALVNVYGLPDTLDTVVKGLSDSRPLLRRVWAIACTKVTPETL